MALIAAGAIAAVGGLVVGSLFGTKNTATEISSLEQQFTNNITNINNSTCTIDNVEIAADTRVILNNANIGGNVIGAYQGQQTQSTCLLTSTMDTNISQAMQAIAQQDIAIANGTVLSAGSNTTADTKIIQQMVNNLTNINNQMCNVDNVQIADDTFLYVRDSNVSGNVAGVVQTSNPTSNCAINNTMKNVVFQQAQAQSTQNIKVTSLLETIVVILVLVIVVIIIIGIVFALIKASSSKKASAPPAAGESKTPPTPAAPSAQQSLLNSILSSPQATAALEGALVA